MIHMNAMPRHDSWPWAGASTGPQTLCEVVPGLQLVNDSLHLPFDVMRSQHAQAVHAGLLANSILGSRDFERAVDALEHITLGPFARHV
ncbi:MAG: hypothetical protein Q7U73_03420 [Rubrivivax sp.]|nr:hypothetical protein [Rubrivivax sp.]